jgi:hypothetical protein
MQAILSAMQEDTLVGREMAKASHELAQEMKRDSVAMRTVRIKSFHDIPRYFQGLLLTEASFSRSPSSQCSFCPGQHLL